MKKILVVSALMASAVVIVWVAAAMVLDPQKIKAEFTKALERSFGRPVEVGQVQVRWDGFRQLRMDVREIVVYSDREQKALPLFRVARVEGNLSLWPLLKKEIRLNRVRLENPFIWVTVVAPGKISVAGLAVPSGSSPARSSERPATGGARRGGFELRVNSIEISNGRIRYQDFTKGAAGFVELDKADIKIDRFSLTRSFGFEAAAALVSRRDQNLRVKGSLRLPSAKGPGLVENCRIDTDLQQLDFEALKRLWPAAGELALEAPFSGTLEVHIDALPFVSDWPDRVKAAVYLRDVSATLSAFGIPIEKVLGVIRLDNTTLTIETLTGNLAAGTFGIQAQARSFRSPAGSLELKTNLTGLDLGRLSERFVRFGQTSLTGRLTLEVEARARGVLSRQTVEESLTGKARLILADGIILNYNLFKDVSAFLSVLPQAGSLSQLNLPEAFKRRAEGRDTVLLPMNLYAEIRDGVFYFESFEIATELLSIRGKGTIGFDGNVTGEGLLRFQSNLSGAFVSLVTQLAPLLNSEGQMEFPVKLKGHLPHFKIIPDSRYIFTRVVVRQAQAAVDALMKDPKKNLGPLGALFEKRAE